VVAFIENARTYSKTLDIAWAQISCKLFLKSALKSVFIKM